MKGVEHGLDAGAHFFETGHGAVAHLDALGVEADLLLCGFEFQASLLDEIVDHGNLVDIGRGVEARAVVVALGFDDGEVFFPEGTTSFLLPAKIIPAMLWSVFSIGI